MYLQVSPKVHIVDAALTCAMYLQVSPKVHIVDAGLTSDIYLQVPTKVVDAALTCDMYLQVPTKVHIVDAIPKSDAAKVQRYQLTKQYTREANGNQGEAFTSEAILQHVQEAWGQELGSAPESLTANFFGSGGGSMQVSVHTYVFQYTIYSSILFICTC